MDKVQVSVTPEQVPSGNSFSFMFTVAFHLYVFLGTTQHDHVAASGIHASQAEEAEGLGRGNYHVQTGYKGLSHSHLLAT